jgi:hypothetical protein
LSAVAHGSLLSETTSLLRAMEPPQSLRHEPTSPRLSL